MANKLYAMEQLTEEVAKDVSANPQEWICILPSATRLPRKWRRNMVLTKNRKATSLNCLQMKTITFGHRCFTALQAATDRS